MSVKVVRTELKRIGSTPTYSEFSWICEGCGHENTDEVRDVMLLMYKKESLGPMDKDVACEKCGSKHEVRLVME